MVRFETKIKKSYAVYKAIEDAVGTFKKESNESFAVFGSLTLLDQMFRGVVIGQIEGQKINDVLDQVLATVKVPEAPPTPMMTAKAGTFTYGQMIKAGWTNDQLLEHGYIEDDVPF